ncbi:MAG: hypothetical protein K8F91_03630 [Candidatus Obscuribacterales bacterium]|nr:hypothetical protein [Candidatus Obscuribacterales bacterium]
MAQPQPEDHVSFHHVLKLVDQLSPAERQLLHRRLELQVWDEKWKQLKEQLTVERARKGLPPPTDEEIHDLIDAIRTPEQLEALRREIQKGIDSLDGGKGIPAEQVFADVKERIRSRKAAK